MNRMIHRLGKTSMTTSWNMKMTSILITTISSSTMNSSRWRFRRWTNFWTKTASI